MFFRCEVIPGIINLNYLVQVLDTDSESWTAILTNGQEHVIEGTDIPRFLEAIEKFNK